MWGLDEEGRRRMTTLEVDYLSLCAIPSIIRRIENYKIRNRIAARETIIERIKNKCLFRNYQDEETKPPLKVLKELNKH